MDIWTIILTLIWIPAFFFMMKRLRRKSKEGSPLHKGAYRWLSGWIIFGLIMILVSIFVSLYISNMSI
jgi:hypothetical protein